MNEFREFLVKARPWLAAALGLLIMAVIQSALPSWWAENVGGQIPLGIHLLLTALPAVAAFSWVSCIIDPPLPEGRQRSAQEVWGDIGRDAWTVFRFCSCAVYIGYALLWELIFFLVKAYVYVMAILAVACVWMWLGEYEPRLPFWARLIATAVCGVLAAGFLRDEFHIPDVTERWIRGSSRSDDEAARRVQGFERDKDED